MATDEEQAVPTHGHEHDDHQDSTGSAHRGRKDGPDIDTERREKENDREAGHQTDRSLAT